MMILKILALLFVVVSPVQVIDKFGAIPHQDTISAQFINQEALMSAIKVANSSTSTGDQRIVVIPKGHTYYSMPITLNYVRNVKIEVQGKLIASKNVKNWPKGDKKSYNNFIDINDCFDLEIHGGGKIDGRGYIWWLMSWTVNKKYLPANSHRPHLIAVDRTMNISIHDLTLKNSPCYHVKLDQTINGLIYNLDIKVNTTTQLQLMKKFPLSSVIRIFPLNTDGIDPMGRNFHIYNITCQNYDDVVVPKPAHSGHWQMNCTENMLIQNITVRLGVGLTIGTVPPRSEVNCVRNITFRNAFMEKPFKGIYLKTNPGKDGWGIIQDILYQNITMHQPIWWAIYLGPQQQKQPDGGGPGCMFYPFGKKQECITQKLVNISNIKLKDIKITNSLLFPIVMRCNETNLCKNISFQNVQAHKWRIGKKDKGFVCENVEGNQINSYPKLDCLTEIADKKLFVEEVSNLREERQKHLRKMTSEEGQFIQYDEYKLMLTELQKASKEVPYIEEDDDMQVPFQLWSDIDYTLDSLS